MAKKTAKTASIAPIAPVKSRGGRIAGLMEPVLKALSGSGDTISNVATKLAKAGHKVTQTDEATGKVTQVAVTERDVRLAIDKARHKMGYAAIQRVAPKTFRFAAAPAKPPRKRTPKAVAPKEAAPEPATGAPEAANE